MRKDRRLTRVELAPYMVEVPAVRPLRTSRVGGLSFTPSPLEGEAGESKTSRVGGQGFGGGGPQPSEEHPPPAGTCGSGDRPLQGGGESPAPPHPQPVAPGGEGSLLDWPALFGNANPVEVEVGFGKGLFLVSEGVANPHVNYFGVEIVRKYQLYATTRVAVRKLPNVKTCCGDAKRVLREMVPAGSVRTVHVFFPDPWWKARHKKRLLFTAEFAALVLRALTPGGVLHFVTDVKDYFDMVTGLVAAEPAFRELPPPAENTPRSDMDYLTNFERKFRKEGRPIYRSRWEKSGAG